MTNEQRALARHALGLPNSRNRSYRNRYFCHRGTDAFAAWSILVGKRLARSCRADNQVATYRLFWLTRSGANAALRKNERLDPEDFPDDRG